MNKNKNKTIAHYGTFDVDNYGDLLFPHITSWRLEKYNVVNISPTSARSHFIDAAHTISYQESKNMDCRAVLVGGGNILFMRKTDLKIYQSCEYTAYYKLWVGSARLAAKKSAVLLFNGASIRGKRHTIFEKLTFRNVFNLSSYAALRDPKSVELFNNISKHSKAVLIPDTAIDISRMWPKKDFPASEKEYFVAHVNERYCQSPEDTALALDEIAMKLNMSCKLLPIGPCHNDIAYASQVKKYMSQEAELVNKLSVRCFAREIANSSAYIGSSMHGYITALSYSIPCLLVLNDEPMQKFLGLLNICDIGTDKIAKSWSCASSKLHELDTLAPRKKQFLFNLLDKHWQNIVETIERDHQRHSRFTLIGLRLLVFNLFFLNTGIELKRVIKRVLRSSR